MRVGVLSTLGSMGLFHWFGGFTGVSEGAAMEKLRRSNMLQLLPLKYFKLLKYSVFLLVFGKRGVFPCSAPCALGERDDSGWDRKSDTGMVLLLALIR